MLPIITRLPVLRTLARARAMPIAAASSRVTPATLNLSFVNTAAARRTFLTTSRLAFPSAKPKSGSKTTAKKKSTSAAKTRKASKSSAVGSAAKKILAEKKSKPTKSRISKTKRKTRVKAKKPVLKVKKADLPPTRPGNPYVLFFAERVISQHAKSISDTQAIASESAKVWRGLGDEEKEPYVQKHKELKAAYEQAATDYWASLPREMLAAINKKRKSKGLKRLQRTRAFRRGIPITTYFRFAADFRLSPEADELRREGKTAEGPAALRIARLSGRRWRELPEAEKQPYIDAYQRDYDEWVKTRDSERASTA
ncbi:hypothetical protein SERLA73DRAFT_188283 [Serpula lacrymans var. lacrymans S7.3]|uniref:HMG box domain-containing protein n=2 Tax=Serpula lacrymans var. lacrymans TaxID=341189 RepID=F8QB23_SERL3|nr:uncharacterized protein SERLADRAFT_478344 [Serpula lacrymans var. lacrymans S7.9]EGN94409.1 hypothetical protein SERLA73DRAFT_188283 [Serpula lacrymans var. lacrymans S7.3]EGO19890.1 hypothetical protein SERLADRAFT_478344 [Serpula lacrymans var. lacrymans S7.9]